jgi:hypothetical protein
LWCYCKYGQALRGVALLLAAAATLAAASCRGLLGASLGRLRALLPEVEHRVYKVHVGVYRLLGELLAGLGSALLLIGQLRPICRVPSAWVRRFSIVLLKKSSVSRAFCSWALTPRSEAARKRLYEGVGELFGRLVHPLLLLLVHQALALHSCSRLLLANEIIPNH